MLNLSINKGFDLLPDESVDGIFFDPPYGDNVPYLATIVENDSGTSPYDRTIVFCDKNTKELLDKSIVLRI